MKKIINTIFLVGFSTIGAFASKEIVIDLEEQRGYAVEGGEIKFSGKISSGVKGKETPRGNFKITEKKEKHKSTLWPKPNGGAKMPYMMRLSGSPYALHLGHVPNRPDSHGCVRLENGFAQKIYKWADIGTKVNIKGRFSWEDFYAEEGVSRAHYRPKTKGIVSDEVVSSQKAKYEAKRTKMQEEDFELMGYYEDEVTGVVELY